MGQQEYDNFKRLIREWLDSHPDEYAAFVEEMNDKEFKGFCGFRGRNERQGVQGICQGFQGCHNLGTEIQGSHTQTDRRR